MGSIWSVEQRSGPAGALHGAWPLADPGVRSVALCRVEGPSVVLGSTQPDTDVDRTRAEQVGLSVIRRRSGGGAVLVAPGDPVWIDAWVPRGDQWWDDDVARAFDWLGETWTRALHSLGYADLSPHRGGFRSCSRWSSLVCFGGVGTGEVVTGDGHKVVGLAQRRTRDGAWFHSACVLHWEPAPLLDVLDLPDSERRTAGIGLGEVATGLNDGWAADIGPHDREAVESAFLDALP